MAFYSREESFLVLKICTTNQMASQELAISRHIRDIDSDHFGKRCLRVSLEDFEITSPAGAHQCLLFAPSGLALTQMRDVYSGGTISRRALQGSLLWLLTPLDFLHQAGVVHTDSFAKQSHGDDANNLSLIH